jgi:hypothetical protein
MVEIAYHQFGQVGEDHDLAVPWPSHALNRYRHYCFARSGMSSGCSTMM